MTGTYYFILYFFRECDSRNLNIDPLCTLGGGPLPKLWLNGVGCPQKTFHDIAFSKDIVSLCSLGDQEVRGVIRLFSLLHLQPRQPDEEETPGRADCNKGNFWLKVMVPHVEMINRVIMAILHPLGWPGWFQPIQCLGGGYRCGQHLLRQGDCYG